MPDWLASPFQADADFSLTTVLARQAAAFALGCVIAGVYHATRGRPDGEARSLAATLVLLTVLIAMITAAIGNNVARAFSLVGALSIVRFRTVVEDTRDTAFVIFAVAVGMAVGAGYLVLPLISIPITALAAYLFRPVRAGAGAEQTRWTLTLRLAAAHADDPQLAAVLDAHAPGRRLTRLGTIRQGAGIEYAYAIEWPAHAESSSAALLKALDTLDGVLEVVLRAE